MSNNPKNDAVTIIRAPRDGQNPYFMQRRATAQDESLSYEARGVLSYLLSKPGNWEIRIGDLITDKCGRDKVYRILKELKASRYLKREKKRGNDGQWIWSPYELYESPYPENPDTAQPDTEKPEINTEKRGLQSRDLQKEILAPDGACATSGNGEPSQEAQLARALFSAVAAHVYGIDGEDANGAGGRIGKISNWLAGKYAGRGENKVGQISHPASPEHVARFAAWYKSEHPGVTLPRDFVKFVESWRAWATAQRTPKPQRVTYTQEELDAMAREMMRERYGIDQ